MTNLSKINKNGESYAIYNPDMINGGGFHCDCSKINYRIAKKFSTIKDFNIRLAKLKIILEILNELKICTVEELPGGIYRYDIYFSAEKTNIEKSSILKKIKNQCINN